MMTLREAALAVGAVTGDERVVTRVSTDSRSIAPGELFVALRGETFDGHAFLADVARAGALAAIVERQAYGNFDAPPGFTLIPVDDVLSALGRLAAWWRSRFDCPLVALTGSSGKTTVKEMLAGILREAAGPDGVLATKGNLNNHIGVPLTLLALRDTHRYAVIEMGMNHAGEIRYLSGLAAPEVALVNNAGSAHIEYLGTEDAIAAAKGEIFEGLVNGGAAIINADDRFAPIWRDVARGHRRIGFGLDKPADVSATYTLGELSSDMVLRLVNRTVTLTLPTPGVHNVRNALAAAAAAFALGVAPDCIARGLSSFAGVKGRLQRRHTATGATLIDDTYNANPESVRAAIETLARLPGKRMLVFGDMGELGTEAPRLHREIGETARHHALDALYALGNHSAETVRAFGQGGRHFDSVESLVTALSPELVPHACVLVKGSRFMRMERVVEALAGKPAAGGGIECC